jgi:hypothetical protein
MKPPPHRAGDFPRAASFAGRLSAWCAGPAVWLAALVASSPAQSPVPDKLSSLEPDQAGQMLAESLRTAAPAEDADFRGVLKTRSREGQTNLVPFTLHVRAGQTNWQVIYETASAGGLPAETLIVLHAPGRANEYRLARAARPGGPPDGPVPLAGGGADRPLAGSEFWLSDLGLDFLHWPTQRVLKTEMRKGRVCHVLESTGGPVSPGGYARVVSWIDKETGGPLLAEAYGRDGRLLKEFSIRSLKKVQGRWQLQEMSIRNLQTRSRTWIEFNFPPE